MSSDRAWCGEAIQQAALTPYNDDWIHQHDERLAEHDRRLSQVENNTRLIIALVAGFIVGAVLVGIIAALVMMP